MKNLFKTHFFINIVVLSITLLLSNTQAIYAAVPEGVLGDLTITIEDKAIKVDWIDVKGDVNNYNIYVDDHAIDDNEEYAEIVSTKDNTSDYLIETFKGEPIKENLTYYFSVTASNDDGESMNYSKEAYIKYAPGTESSDLESSDAMIEEISADDLAASDDIVQGEENSEDSDIKDEISLELVTATASNKNTVIVIFNQEVEVDEDLVSEFYIEDKDEKELIVESAELQSDKLSIKITTEDQVSLEEYEVTVGIGVTTLGGEPVISGVADIGKFIGSDVELIEELIEEPEEVLHQSAGTEEETDGGGTIELKDVSNLRSKYKYDEDTEKFIVDLKWSNTDGEGVKYQNIRQKTGNSSYSTAIKIDKDKTSYQAELVGGKRYTFKISTVDTLGNESTGALSSIILPETGPALLLGLTGLFSAAGAGYFRRRKKK